MAGKKKIETANENTVSQIQNAKPVGNATGYRIGAIVLWVLALVCELMAVLMVFNKITITFMNTLICILILIVLDLVFLIIGSQLWKKANHIRPASKKNPTKFWLWNNMGLIVAVLCFVPLIVILLTNKELDKKTRTIAVVAAAIALLVGGAASIDYNPISAEEKAAAEAVLTGGVYYTPYGRVYHTHVNDDGSVTKHPHTTDDGKDCPYLNRSDSLTYGMVSDAIAAGKTRLCSYCARKDQINTEGIKTDGAEEPPANP
ncbi:MAG: hypothetical protein J6H18_00700 [Lachnospiraceae bacterium]|nr:hypothetical protein [Lachnospiraceae bacterium]